MVRKAEAPLAEPVAHAGTMARITGITYSLAPDRAFTTKAAYRYGGAPSHAAEIRLDPHRYDLFVQLVQRQQSGTVGPEEVAALVHDLYFCLYAPKPSALPPQVQQGRVPDRP